jgi:hypothetical protein
MDNVILESEIITETYYTKISDLTHISISDYYIFVGKPSYIQVFDKKTLKK